MHGKAAWATPTIRLSQLCSLTRKACRYSATTSLVRPMLFDYRMSVIADHANIEQDNKFLDPSHSKSSLQDAKDLLARNGSLSEAALLLEAAIQHGDLGEGGYEAWILLGETRAMDERDEAAMRALLEGVKRAEAAGAAGAGMLVSGVMHVIATAVSRAHCSPSQSPLRTSLWRRPRTRCSFAG